MSSPEHYPDTPAFAALLDAYARWQDFEQKPAQGTGALTPSNVPLPTSPPLVFIMACPYIDVQDIPEGERNCSICTDPYNHLSDRAKKDRSVKVAQRLPCGHHLCDNCMYQWLDPFAQSNNNTCPFDRRVLFPKFPPFLHTEGIQERLDLLDWFNGARGRVPMGAERDRTAGLKALLVERRLGEAIEELELDRSKADDNLMVQSRINAAALSACSRELQLFERRLNAIRAIADAMLGHVQTLTLQARLQCLTERLARD